MKLKKLAITLVLVFVLSSCTRQTEVSSLPQHEMSRATEQSPSSRITDISEESSNPSEASEPAEIDIVELTSKFAEDTGRNNPIVKRIVDNQERYYVVHDEVGTLTENLFSHLVFVDSYPNISGIQIKTATGSIYFNRNSKVEIEQQGLVKAYELGSFLGGNLMEFPINFEYPSIQSLYSIGGYIWFHQDETSITFISVYFDAEYEMGSTTIVRYDLDTFEVESKVHVDEFACNCLLDNEILYVLWGPRSHAPTPYHAASIRWKDLVFLNQSEEAELKRGTIINDLFIQNGMLCGNYLSEGEEAVVEIMAAN